MLAKLRNRAEDEQGFTLIELLVVILIIGILAAVAIPTFLNQRGKAYDSNAQTMAKDAQIAEETFATSNNGTYASSASQLTSIDPTLTAASTNTNTANGPEIAITGTTATNNYQIVVTAQSTGDQYTLAETLGGATIETCSGASANGAPGACPTSDTW